MKLASNPRIPNSKSNIKVAAWVDFDNVPWRASNAVEWTYQRGEDGDLVVFARTKEEAIATIEGHGFRNLSLSKLKQTGGTLTDYLKREEIK